MWFLREQVFSTENIAKAVDIKGNALYANIDLKKESDTIDPSLLQQKCQHYWGGRGVFGTGKNKR